MPDVQGKLDEIITLVETAKGKALSGSACVIDRTVMLAALEELRQLLPAEMSEARSVLRERMAVHEQAQAKADEIVGRARADAERTLSDAQQERARLLSESDVIQETERVAAEITAAAEAEAARMREQTDDYVDASLARFEQLLASSLETVSRGRARVAASRAQAEMAQYGEQYSLDEAAPSGQDPSGGEAPVDVRWDSAAEAAGSPAR